MNSRPKIGVMGSASTTRPNRELRRLAARLGRAVAERNCILITGATTGFPEIVSRAARQHGGLTIGISPASSKDEHILEYRLPDDAVDVIVYTGFGLKGRNVVNVRACDIVIIFGGGMGTLNEFTIAYDEGKIIGVLDGTGGVADRAKELAAQLGRERRVGLIANSSPEELIDNCLKAFAELESSNSLERKSQEEAGSDGSVEV